MDEDHVARAALTRLAEPGDTALGAALRVHGPQEVLRVLQADGPLPEEFRRRDPAGYRVRLGGPSAADDLATLTRLGGRFVVPGDRHWPTQLDDLGDARPIGLWERGPVRLRHAALRSVSVVGSRAGTDYGTYVTHELTTSLAEADWTVVSGGAYGIDGAAHRGSLAGGGPTVAVLACGVDVAYPRGHDRLLARIGETGTLVSELPPGCTPSRVRFVERNRVIAVSLGFRLCGQTETWESCSSAVPTSTVACATSVVASPAQVNTLAGLVRSCSRVGHTCAVWCSPAESRREHAWSCQWRRSDWPWVWLALARAVFDLFHLDLLPSLASLALSGSRRRGMWTFPRQALVGLRT